jgi:hypothetical protein
LIDDSNVENNSVIEKQDSKAIERSYGSVVTIETGERAANF